MYIKPCYWYVGEPRTKRGKRHLALMTRCLNSRWRLLPLGMARLLAAVTVGLYAAAMVSLMLAHQFTWWWCLIGLAVTLGLLGLYALWLGQGDYQPWRLLTFADHRLVTLVAALGSQGLLLATVSQDDTVVAIVNRYLESTLTLELELSGRQLTGPQVGLRFRKLQERAVTTTAVIQERLAALSK